MPVFLQKIAVLPEKIVPEAFPFNTLPYLTSGFTLHFTAAVTIFVGENGSGKSTLLEAIARHCGFNIQGDGRDHVNYARPLTEDGNLADALRLSWLPKVTDGFFFRAESMFQFAQYIDNVGNIDRQGGRLLHAQSHGESFLALFQHRLQSKTRAICLLDEPEAALSPARQLVLLSLIKEWEKSGRAQLIIATHSPIILGYPGAALVNFEDGALSLIRYEDTQHYRIMKSFLNNPQKIFLELLKE